eukprot:SAG11_NODE_13327_length_660_cov_0.716578_1_plen_78_part_10
MVNNWNFTLPNGGRISHAENLSDVEVACRRAAKVPGPGQYHMKRDLRPSGGRFNMSNPKSDIEWQIHRASKQPGPGEY